MTGSTTPLNFPYLTPADNLSQLAGVMQQLAEAVDDYLSAISIINPSPAASAPLSSGWTGSAWYARRAGMTTLVLAVARSTFEVGYEILTPLPAGFRPLLTVKASGLYGTAGRPFQINEAGQVTVDGNTTQTGGIFGTVTYPV